MRMRWLFLVLCVSTASPGCSLFVTAARDVSYEVKLRVQECREDWRNRQSAQEAWESAYGKKNDNPDHACGFKAGFADYLSAGGTGMPPPLPPRHYWGYKYQTPAGHEAIEQWYAGYKEGAAAAQASGLRQLVLVPTHSGLLPATPPPLPPPPPPVPLVPPPVRSLPTETLPRPTPVGGLNPDALPRGRPGGLATSMPAGMAAAFADSPREVLPALPLPVPKELPAPPGPVALPPLTGEFAPPAREVLPPLSAVEAKRPGLQPAPAPLPIL